MKICNEAFSKLVQEECPPVKGEDILTKRELRSEDRDKNLYPNPNDVTYDLGDFFEDIQSISIDPQGLEFPNTLDGITLNNNSVKWCFFSSPTIIYECFIPCGNYVLDTILSTILEQMNLVMNVMSRVFTVQFTRESRLVSFTSYLNVLAPSNPLSIQANVATVTLTLPNHNLNVGDEFLLTVTGASDLGGLSTSDLSGIFQVTAVDDLDHFEFVLANDIPYNSGQLGGNNITVGRLDPFKFIHSDISILPQVGFVAEDSASICTSMLSPVSFPATSNGFLITTNPQPHYARLGDNVTFVGGGIRTETNVIEVIDATTIRVNTNIPSNSQSSLENSSLVMLTMNNICENQGIVPTQTYVSGPKGDQIKQSEIFYVDNNHVIVRPSSTNSPLQTANTFRVSSPSVFGFSSTQTSLINGVSLQYINLQGMTSVAVILPDIETNYHAKNVKRIWTKIQLSDQATSDLFNTQSSTQGTFEWPAQLRYLRIKIVTMQNEPVDFQGMNYSFTIYIRTNKQPKYRHKLYYT